MKRLESLFNNLGDVRDGILVGISVLYALGFVTWSLFAWGAKLGAAPAFQMQYFVAGLPVLFIIGLTVALGLLLRWLVLDIWPTWFSKRKGRLRIFFIALIAVTILAAIFQIYIRPLIVPNATTPLWSGVLTLSIFTLGSMMLTILDGGGEAQRAGYAAGIYALIAIVAILPILYFALIVYPRIPQAFGGGNPRCANLDLYTERFSKESLSELAPVSAQDESIVRSYELGVLFSSQDAMYVFVAQQDKTFLRYEIDRGDVSAIKWCDEKNAQEDGLRQD